MHQTDSPKRSLIVVLGMHRSGTSAIAQSLEALGVSLGDELMPPSTDNPKGFFEDLRIYDLNERLLGLLGLRWFDLPLIRPEQWQLPQVQALRQEARELLQARMTQFPLWGFKDPRSVRLLPFWHGLFEELHIAPRYLLGVRNPLSLAKSLEQRDGMAVEWGLWLGLVHLVPYLELIRDFLHVVVDYDRLLANPHAQLERIAHALQLEPDRVALERYASGFLTTNLRHSTFTEEELTASPLVDGLTLECVRLLRQKSQDEPDADFWAAWRSLAEDLRRIAPMLAFLGKRQSSGTNLERNQMLAQNADLRRQIDYLRDELTRREALIDNLCERLEQAGLPGR